MSIASRIESMYEHVGDVYDTITNVELPENKNIENIPDTIKNSYLKIMNEGYQEIWDNWDKRTASGTEISINGTEEAPMSLAYKGNTYQYSSDVAGKNLFNYNGTHYVNRGVLTINDEELKLDQLSADFNGQAWWAINVSNYTGNITISYGEMDGDPATGDERYLAYCFMNSIPTTWNDMGTLTVVDKTNKYATASLGSGNYLILVLQAQHGNAYVDGWASINEVQVELGSSPTSYEPFAGVTPSPENPSPVQVVSGDNSIEVCGKNLFNKDTTNVLKAYINGSSVITSSTSDKSYWLPIQKNTNYTIKMTQLALSTSQYIDDFQCGLFATTPVLNLTGNRVFSKTRPSATQDYTFTETFNSGNYDYLVIKVGNSTRTNITESLKTLQLEVGTTATTYEEYKSASYPISLGVENLFDKDNANILDASLSGISISASDSNKTLYIPCKPETTYTVSKIASNRFSIGDTAANEPLISKTANIITDNTATHLTITTGNSAQYLCVTYYINTDTLTEQEILDTIQIVEGTKINSYTPYGKYIELCKIGTYQDKIFKNTPNTTDYDSNLEDNVWYLKKEIGKVVLDGTNGWWQGISVSQGLLLRGADLTSNAALGKQCLCDYYRGIEVTESDFSTKRQNGDIYINPSNPYIDIIDNTQSDVNSFKTWLSNNNTTVYYVLSTPTYETITDTTLLSQLEALKKSYEGQTNISQINNDMPFELDAVALSDGTVASLSLGSPLLGSSSQPEETQEETEEPIEESE